MISIIVQVFIAILGVTGIYLANDHRPHLRRYACLFGLAAQPFWFVSSWMTEQWGIFGLCFLYTWAWFKGFRNQWLKKDSTA